MVLHPEILISSKMVLFVRFTYHIFQAGKYVHRILYSSALASSMSPLGHNVSEHSRVASAGKSKSVSENKKKLGKSVVKAGVGELEECAHDLREMPISQRLLAIFRNKTIRQGQAVFVKFLDLQGLERSEVWHISIRIIFKLRYPLGHISSSNCCFHDFGTKHHRSLSSNLFSKKILFRKIAK
jgi:hypothetical protein